MATIKGIQTEEEKDKESSIAPQTVQTGPQSISTGNTGASGSSQFQSLEKRPKGSGRFTNIQQYLSANTGGAKKIGSGISNRADQYMNKVAEGIQASKDVTSGIQSEKDRLLKATDYGRQIQDDARVAAQNNLDDITQLRKGISKANTLQAQGTKGLSDLTTNLNPLSRLNTNLKTESGRFDVLSNTYGGNKNPLYNMGQRRLDQLFLQNQGNELGNLQGKTQQYTNQGNEGITNLQKALGTGISGIRQGTEEAKKTILDSIGDFSANKDGALGTIYKNLNTQISDRQNYLKSFQQRAKNELSSGDLSQQVADALGITGPIDVSDLNLSKYAKENIGLGDTDVTMADVANLDQEQKLNALAQLAGTSGYDLGNKEGSDVAFDYNKFKDTARKQRDTYEDRFFTQNYWDVMGGRPTPGYEDWTILDEILSGSSGQTSQGRAVTDAGFNALLDPRNAQIFDFKNPTSSVERLADLNNRVTFGALPLYDLVDDVSSRQMLEQALNNTRQKEAANWIPAAGRTDVFQRLLDRFDQSRNRTIGVGGSANDSTYKKF